MINPINNFLDIDKQIKKILEIQGELPSNRVLNAISIRGQDLSKLIEGKIYESYDVSDLFIIFEKVFNPSSTDNVSMTENDGSITNYLSFYIKVLIYGNNSNNVASKIKSRLLTSKVRNDLDFKGIHIFSISNPESMTEFINNTLWIRTDLTLNISCRQIVSQVEEDYEMDTINNIEFKEI